MKLYFIIPITIFVLTTIVFLAIRYKTLTINGKFIRIMKIVGLCCAVLSIIALLVSYYISPSKDITQLFKISIPMLILLMIFLMMRKNRE